MPSWGILGLSCAIGVPFWSQVGAKRAHMAKTMKTRRFFKVFSVPGGVWESETDGAGHGAGGIVKLRFPPKTIEKLLVF